MAEQAGALALDHDRAAALRIAGRAGQRLRNGVADDLVGAQRLLPVATGRRAAERSAQQAASAARSSEHLAGDGAEPGVGLLRLGLARGARRVERADDRAALDLGVLVVDRPIVPCCEIA